MSRNPERSIDVPLGERAHLRASLGDGGTHRLVIEGELRLGWLGTLSRRLAGAGLDIVSLDAERDERGAWRAEVVLLAASGATDPLGLDYGKLLEDTRSSEPVRGEPRLVRATLEREGDGTLVLHLVAKNELGLLSRILGRLGFLGAFPERVRAFSEGLTVADTFWLRGFGRAALSETSEQALRAAFLVPSSRPPNPSVPPKA